MTEVKDGTQILRDHIYELAGHGLISDETADEWNDELESLSNRIEDAYDSKTNE